MAIYAIGDVQGCYDALLKLLKKLRYNGDRDQLWFCGDLVNRGPQSLEVLRFVHGLGDGAVTVLGNHDLYLVERAHRNIASSGRDDTLAPIFAAADCDTLIAWLELQPFLHHSPEHNAVMVHAGIPPTWTRKQTFKRARKLHREWRKTLLGSLRDPPPTHWQGKLSAVQKQRFTCAALTRMRFVDKYGDPEYSAKGHPRNYRGRLSPWFDYLDADWDATRIFFGHWSTLDKTGFDSVIALDSGCVWGRALSAARVDADEPVATVTSVDCDAPQRSA